MSSCKCESLFSCIQCQHRLRNVEELFITHACLRSWCSMDSLLDSTSRKLANDGLTSIATMSTWLQQLLSIRFTALVKLLLRLTPNQRKFQTLVAPLSPSIQGWFLDRLITPKLCQLVKILACWFETLHSHGWQHWRWQAWRQAQFPWVFHFPEDGRDDCGTFGFRGCWKVFLF